VQPLSNRGLQTNQHATRAQNSVEYLFRCQCAVIQQDGELDLEFELFHRSDRVVKEGNECATSLPATSLGDIGTDGNGRTAHLLGEAESLRKREPERESIDRYGQLPSLTIDN
jgi:hypothetical protein